MKKIKLKKYLKFICFVFVGLLTFTLTTLSVSAETRGFAARAFRLNGEIRWKLYNVRSGNTLNGVKFITPSDGVIAYCIEPSIDALLIEDGVYDLNTNPMYFGSITGLSEETLNELELISFYGYGYNGDYSDITYMATQLEIWQTVQPGGVQYASGDFSEVDTKRAEIRNNVNKAKVLPSFSYEVKDVIIGQETSFTDTSNVLSKFKVSSCTNCTATIKGNTLIVKSNSIGKSSITLTKTMENGTGTSILYTKGSYQKLMTFSHPADFISRLTLNTLGGKVKINKLDKDSNSSTPQSIQSSLKGAVYGIYKEDGTKVGTLTTDQNGYAESDYLSSLGKFYLQEEKSSTGYLLDDTKYYFNITEDNLNPVVKVYEQGIKRDVEISKFYSQSQTGILTPETNIKFGFYDTNNNLVATITTDNQGWGKTTLPYGDYTVKQLNSNPNTEKVKDFTVSIKDNSSNSLKYSIVNEELSAKIKVVKIDSESNKVLVRDGIKFKIKNLDTNEYVCQNITYPTQKEVCIFETSEGAFITPYVLKAGNYQIEELEDQLIDGYVWNKEPLKFSINDESELIEDEDFGIMLEVKFGNKQVKAEVEIFKYGEKFIIEDNSIKYEEIKLDGVLFELYANGNIYSQDGTLIYEDKELVETFSTLDGYYKLSNLYLGNYCLVEKESVLNHKIDDTPLCFSLEYKDQYTEIISLSFTLKNYLKKGTLDFTKTDLATGEVIPNTLIEIYTEKDELIFSGYTSEDGKIIIPELPTNMKFYIIEKEAATGFLISDEKVYFEILEDGEIVKANMTNEKIKGILEFLKVDESGNPLADTEIEIYNADTDELVFKGITGSDGKITLELEYSKYYLVESKASNSFVLNDEKIYFEIKKQDEVIEITMTNEKIKGILEFLKVDSETGDPLANTEIEIYNADTDELVFKGITGSDGKITLELEYSNYYLVESKASDGYVLNDEKIYFEIKEQDEIVEISMTNEKIEMPETFNTDLISKIIIITTALLGVGLLIYEKNKNK